MAELLDCKTVADKIFDWCASSNKELYLDIHHIVESYGKQMFNEGRAFELCGDYVMLADEYILELEVCTEPEDVDAYFDRKNIPENTDRRHYLLAYMTLVFVPTLVEIYSTYESIREYYLDGRWRSVMNKYHRPKVIEAMDNMSGI